VKIGSLASTIELPLKFLEKYLLAKFTEITAMGKNNKQIIEEYYSTEKLGVEVKLLNLWGRGNYPNRWGKKADNVVRVVFGGQIIKGRKLEVLIEFFGKLKERGILLNLDIYSKGSDFDQMKETYEDFEWLKFKELLPRKEYFSLLLMYDFGVIVTDNKSNLPTFPSKIIDYIEAGLKVYCLVEKESELFTILGNNKSIYLNNFNFSEEEINNSSKFFTESRNDEIESDINKVKDIFSVKTAVARLMA
jgi:hypothetical protein